MRISDWSSDVCSSDLFGEHFRFGFAFQIELVDALFQRDAHFVRRLADAGKNDALRRDARRDGAQQFARRHDVRAQAQLRQRRSEEHTSELQSLMRISYAVFCLKKKKRHKTNNNYT